VIYVFGLVFAIALLLAYQIKKTPLDRKQSPVQAKVAIFKVASQRRSPDATSISDAAVPIEPRAPGFGRRTRD
jgi:hypothetical protein